MDDGTCFIYNGSSSLYAFPSLTCTEGQTVSGLTNVQRQTYTLINGRYVLTRVDTLSNQYPQYSEYVWHRWDNSRDYGFSRDSFILPATLLVICFFYIIYKWFIRLRG